MFYGSHQRQLNGARRKHLSNFISILLHEVFVYSHTRRGQVNNFPHALFALRLFISFRVFQTSVKCYNRLSSPYTLYLDRRNVNSVSCWIQNPCMVNSTLMLRYMRYELVSATWAFKQD